MKKGPPTFGANAFSLIEIIGVLAIVAIAATMILSATTKTIDVGVSKQESATLQSQADALQNSVVRNRHIPNATDWYQVIATEMGVSTNAVLYNLAQPGLGAGLHDRSQLHDQRMIFLTIRAQAERFSRSATAS